MDQPKISRILRLIVLMSGNRIYTVDELAAELETSQRTIYRYIDTFKEAGLSERFMPVSISLLEEPGW